MSEAFFQLYKQWPHKLDLKVLYKEKDAYILTEFLQFYWLTELYLEFRWAFFLQNERYIFENCTSLHNWFWLKTTEKAFHNTK